jgi:hypothetical protein
MAATMSRNISNIAEITKLMDESKATGIKTLGPDVNESLLKFSVNRKGDIRFGLGAIKGVGESAVQSILDERAKNGLYKDVFDFVQRVNLSSCNRKNIENLALAGAFDSFSGIKREDFFMENAKGETFTEVLVRYGNKYQLDKAQAVNSLFAGSWQVLLASSVACIISAIANNTMNWSVGKLFKNKNTPKLEYTTRAYISTMIGQFVDNWIFNFILFIVLFKDPSWSILSVTTCAALGAVVELIMEIIFSPVGYKIVQKWRKENVGQEYINKYGTDILRRPTR